MSQRSTKSVLLMALCACAIIEPARPQQLISPCPRLFSYEPQKENDRWYGVVTLISDTDLRGVWLRLVFDRPSLQLGNWFGEIKTTDNMEYLIKNPGHQLKANMPYALRFYITYNPNETPPQLTAVRLNARTVCPEGQSTTPAAITGGNQLITSAPSGGGGGGGGGGATVAPFMTTPPTPINAVAPSNGGGLPTFARPGGGWTGSLPGAAASTDDDDVFVGDFQLINKPHLRPTVEPECGTVVKFGGDVRIKRDNAATMTGGRTPNFPNAKYDVFYVDEHGRQRQQQYSSGNGSLYDFIKTVVHRQQQQPQQPQKLQSQKQQQWTTDTGLTPLTSYSSTATPQKWQQLPISSSITTTKRATTTKTATTQFAKWTAAPPVLHKEDEQIAPLEQQPRPLITYGQGTREGEFPWHVALYHERGADLQYICGASLISSHHVITVAHCVTRRRSATTLNPDSLVVYLGKYYLKKWSNPGIQDSQVSMIIPHPQYNSITYANDLAILKLLNPATFSDYVRPVCLWSEATDLNSVLNKPGTVVGWGFDHTGKVTEELTQAKMPVVTKETCIYSFPDFFSRFTTTKTYCAGFRNGTSVCNGDSGGGMVFPKTIPGRAGHVWQLRGLVSISVALQNQFKCDSSHYVVFTDVAKYLDWIAEAMQK